MWCGGLGWYKVSWPSSLADRRQRPEIAPYISPPAFVHSYTLYRCTSCDTFQKSTSRLHCIGLLDQFWRGWVFIVLSHNASEVRDHV